MTRQIEGRNAVLEAIKAKTQIERIYVQDNVDDPKLDQIKQNNNVFFVTKHKLEAMSKTRRHQGVIAIAKDKPKLKLDEFIENVYNKNQTPLFILLSGNAYEHNLGSVLRSSECFGVHAVITSKNSFGLTPNVVKSSAGASEHIPLIKMDLHAALKIIQKKGLKTVGLSEKSTTLISKSKLNCPLCIIVGAEDKGIKDSLEKYTDEFVKIPMKGKINSLNMAAACSISLYETNKQRK